MGKDITTKRAKTSITRYWGGKDKGQMFQIGQKQKASITNPFGFSHINLSRREIVSLYKKTKK